MTGTLHTRPVEPADRDWIVQVLTEAWTSTRIGSRGRMHDAAALPGLVADLHGRRAGLLTYRIEGDECEIVSLNSVIEGCGAGSALIDAVREVARSAGCRRLWLITSNDNMPALKFYQKREFCLVAVHRGAIDEIRRRKPKIPLTGLYGIPLRDEIELESSL